MENLEAKNSELPMATPSLVVRDSTNDTSFKRDYKSEILKRTTTLRLKAGFHLINYILMSVCEVMYTHQAENEETNALPTPDTSLEELEEMGQASNVKILSPYKFI